MITEAMIKQVHLSPECIPDSWYGAVPNLAEVAPAVLDLRRFKPYLLNLTNIQTTQPAGFANVWLRARYDNTRVEENVAALLPALVGEWRVPAKDFIYFNFYGAALVAGYSTHYSLWVIQPTVAQKLLYGLALTAEEKALADSLGIYNTVEKGILPLPLSQQIEREYHVLGEETHSRLVNIAAANTVYTIETLYPSGPDEFIVLTGLAAAPGAPADDIRLVIDRDDDANYAELRTLALSLVTGGEVAAFIPVLKEIRLTTSSVGVPGAHLFRYSFMRCRMTNLLRARFGLASKDELPGDTWAKVKGGIL